MVREGRVLISSATDPDFGSGYYVTAYEVGAIVASGSYPGTTINVDAGHGFAAGDRLIVNAPMTDYRRVVSVTATSLTLSSSLTPTVGDVLINLGPDQGTTDPTFQYSGATIYSDPDYGTAVTYSTVLTDSNGRYRYYHKGIGIWELVRTPAGVVFANYQDAAQSETVGPDTSTDNAIARWDGTTGETLQNSVVTIGDTGAVTGITTLGVTGTSTLAAVNASGLVAMAAAATVGTTFGVTGASTLTGAVGCGAVTSTGNVTSGGHLRGLVSTEALTTSAAITTAGRFLIDITNTSGTNTPTLVAPSGVDGQLLILRCVALTAGTITLADSGNCALSAAWVPDAGDTLTLVASGVIWYELARSAN